MKSFFPLLRPVAGAFLAAAIFAAGISVPAGTAQAQGGAALSLIRDTEAERVLRSYLDPLLDVAGLDPLSVNLYIVRDPTINAMVAGGQNMFINTGLLTQLDNPNQVTGVMAHETGHMAGGHLVRTQDAYRAAMVPMFLSIAAGIGLAVLGAPDAGAILAMSAPDFAAREFFSYTRVQESLADQAGERFLDATEQSGEGMLEVFRRFEGQEILTATSQDVYARNHPASTERIAQLRTRVESSAYYANRSTPEQQYAFDMLQAKLRGYLNRPATTLQQYPLSDTSKPARYARAMAYFRQPDMQKSLVEIESLLADEPDNPYFLEMYASIKVEMGRVEEGIEPYRKAVEILPDAPLIRVSLGAALLGTENPDHFVEARQQLETALQQERDNPFAWYELAQAYNRLGLTGHAQLATAERYFQVAAYPQAIQFAARAQRNLESGTREWQRANDIVSVSQTQMPARRN